MTSRVANGDCEFLGKVEDWHQGPLPIWGNPQVVCGRFKAWVPTPDLT